MEHELKQCLKGTWGHEKFRPYQLEVIQASLSGRDAFVLMSTGSGKSVCYQLPAVIRRRGMPTGPVTVVVSPLISLMEDQVLSLSNNGIAACLVGGSSDYQNERKAIAGECALVFVTPEKLINWTSALRAMEQGPGLAMFAVDESHCVSEWGHDFRPSYLELRTLRDSFPKVPIMALTATATPVVQHEIMSNLGLRKPFLAKTSFNRSNLHYSVKIVSGQSKDQEISTLLQGLDGSAIIYVMTKKEAEGLAIYVSKVVGSKGARAYHGGMPYAQRRAVHHAFIRDEIQVVVATLAFGMGIDKPDVRLVIHSGMPKTVESYYQQTGRAGRDGLPAKCVLLFSRADTIKQKTIMSMSTNGCAPSPEVLARDLKLLAAMEKFATAPGCRRRALLGYFGEDLGDAKCEGCDSCERAASASTASADGIVKPSEHVELFTKPARLVLQAVKDSGGRYGFLVPISLLMGTKKGLDKVYNAKSKPSFGKGKEQRGRGESFWKALFHQLVEREGFLEGVSFTRDAGRGGSRTAGGLTYRMTPQGESFLANPKAKLPDSFAPSDELAVEGQRVKVSQEMSRPGPSGPAMGLSEDEKQVYELMFKLRSDIASRQGIPPYNVVGAQVLRELAVRRPTDTATLRTVDGMSEKKVADYGTDMIAVIAQACKDLKLEENVQATSSPRDETAWLKPIRDAKPLGNAQITFHEDYMTQRNMTLEQVAAARSRPIAASTAAGYLAVCMENGRVFPWDRRRLNIDPALEDKVVSIVESLKTEGKNPLAVGFPLRGIFDELPPDTDKWAFNVIRFVLARMRFENEGGRLPDSRGEILTRKQQTADTNKERANSKKRALPSWAGSATTRVSSAPSTTPSTASLFTPSYLEDNGSPTGSTSQESISPSPPATGLEVPSYAWSNGAAHASPQATTKPAASTATGLFTPSYAGRNSGKQMKTTPPQAVPSTSGTRLFKPSYTSPSSTRVENAPVQAMSRTTRPWTADVVLGIINSASGNGVTLKCLIEANPGDDATLQSLLASLQDDFVLYTKPSETSGGQPLYLAL